MELANLIHMANRIGTFFEAMPDRAEAVDGIAKHLHLYWEPRMRAALVAHARESGTELLPLVCEAIRLHGAQLTERRAHTPGAA